jgi:hypothetical protein
MKATMSIKPAGFVANQHPNPPPAKTIFNITLMKPEHLYENQ